VDSDEPGAGRRRAEGDVQPPVHHHDRPVADGVRDDVADDGGRPPAARGPGTAARGRAARRL
jgi:hypothetical protein